MSKDTAENDRFDPTGTPLQTITMGRFELAPEFEHLRGAPVGEFETCNTTATSTKSMRPPRIPHPMHGVMSALLTLVAAGALLFIYAFLPDLRDSDSAVAMVTRLGLVLLVALGCGWTVRYLRAKSQSAVKR
jgi:hypothetical protein